MDLGLKKKNCFVAASSRGLGYAAAFELAREGANVIICGREKASINHSANTIREETGSNVVGICADVSQEKEIEKALNSAREHFGGIDVLVTNAGGPPAGFFEDMDDEKWLAGFELTLMSAARMIRIVIPHMKKRGWGRIVNITSVSVKQPIQGLFLSNALRPGVIGMAKSLSEELAPFGITVNNVCPGWTETERVKEIMEARSKNSGLSTREEMVKITQSIPSGRMGKPEELAATIAFLCSQRAGYITGTTLQVDGGAYRGLM